MAESISIHFKTATWDELRPFVNSIAFWYAETSVWFYPKISEDEEAFNEDNIEVRLYDHDSIINEYEDEEIDKLVEALGDFPSSTLTIELRRSKGKQACDAAADVTAQVLQHFEGVVDDGFEIWTPTEIEQGIEKEYGGFLQCYREQATKYMEWVNSRKEA